MVKKEPNVKDNIPPVDNLPVETPETSPQEQKTKPTFNRKKLIIFGGIFLVLLTVTVVFFVLVIKDQETKEDSVPTQLQTQTAAPDPSETIKTVTEDIISFAEYKEVPVNVTPSIPPYVIEEPLNITNKDAFVLSDAAVDLLVKNGFVVVPSNFAEFYSLYEKNRYNYVPNFITTDSLLHNYHMMFNYILEELEKQKFHPELVVLSKEMLSKAQEQYNELVGTTFENAAKRNVGFFAVGAKILDPTINVPPYIEPEVNEELEKIEKHGMILESSVMNVGAGQDIMIDTPQGTLPLDALKEDYTQYIPRGHYDKTEELKAYFKAMMWYGRITFRFKSEDEIMSMILIAELLSDPATFSKWNNLYEPINFFVGKSDDIDYLQIKSIYEETLGPISSETLIPGWGGAFTSFVEKISELDPPKINSMPIFEASINSDRESEIKGFRFMGQRFTIDASIFQRLIFREVGDKEKSCEEYDSKGGTCQTARCLPKGLDIPAAFGSDEAYTLLTEMGETEYACYKENMSKMKDYISTLDKETWTQNLYWGWLYSLKPLTEEKTAGYPMFMTNDAWQRKDLNTFLGSWTELKHDTILYAKQVYAELGGGPVDEPDYRGYVEPNPYVFSRLASLTRLTLDGLESKGLLTEKAKRELERMETLAKKLTVIAEKELNNESLTEEEHETIKFYGGTLEHFWYEIFSDGGRPTLDKDTDAPLVADVATNPNGTVLEEATGYIHTIYVVIPMEDTLRLAKGGVYSYYEFPWDMSDRLTDTKWGELLDSGGAPKQPEWTSTFTTAEK